jgi:hypothetical protein
MNESLATTLINRKNSLIEKYIQLPNQVFDGIKAVQNIADHTNKEEFSGLINSSLQKAGVQQNLQQNIGAIHENTNDRNIILRFFSAIKDCGDIVLQKFIDFVKNISEKIKGCFSAQHTNEQILVNEQQNNNSINL